MSTDDRPAATIATPTPPAAPPRRGPQPVPDGVPYHRVLAGEKRRIVRGIVAIVLLVGGLFAFSIGFSFLGALIDTMLGRSNPVLGGTVYTPVTHASTLFAIALLIPWSMVLQRWLYGVRGASLHSVRSLFRMDVFGRSLLIILPIWTIYLTYLSVLQPVAEVLWLVPDLFAMFAVTVLLTPLQSAGEEYGLRGLTFRIAASWSRGPRTALVIGVLVSSLVFMVIHVAADPWLNLYYFTFGVTLALITWRTGGLELGVVIHAVNNTLAFLLLIVVRGDVLAGFDRSAGVGSAIMLVPCALLIAVTVVVWLRTRRTGPALTPASTQPAALQGSAP
ncbi:CPBP family intramembrane glutamic endopeptidase [Pseudonocardia sp. TRM90224]|uniref:CPBP family intramembrane glutamic endopeptidase n=1 Tax=Pseudonocardia sp. TRM90224 TaxID=2812678 RepID=UPI001E375BEA|nr:CPBP family intramembrane glutamic endopeptidase [Pseudonocardia sp. TRM90224]